MAEQQHTAVWSQMQLAAAAAETHGLECAPWAPETETHHTHRQKCAVEDRTSAQAQVTLRGGLPRSSASYTDQCQTRLGGTLTFRFRFSLARLLAHDPFNVPKDNASPLELPLQPSVPEHLDRACLLDDPHQGYLENPGCHAQLDARHGRQGQKSVADPVLLLGLLRCEDRLVRAFSKSTRPPRRPRKRHTGLCW